MEETDCWNNFCSVLQLFCMQLHWDFLSPTLHPVHRETAHHALHLSFYPLSLHLTFPVLWRWMHDWPVNFDWERWWKIHWRRVPPAVFGHNDLNFCRNCETPYQNIMQFHAFHWVEIFFTGCEQRWHIPV